jgi:hypothetical protein
MLGWFKKEDGSTVLTVVLSVVVALALTAGCLQWYWTNSSSTDIQAVADIGAVAAADVEAKSVQIIQLLDALLLTANLFGLLVHCVVVIAGVVAVVAPPGANVAAGAFFKQAVEFDKNYCERRKKFAYDTCKVAKAVNAATPWLAQAQALRAVNANREKLAAFNQANYLAVAVPLPATGTVELTGFPPEVDTLRKEAAKANKKAAGEAKKNLKLEARVESGRRRCYDLDVYRGSAVYSDFWDPGSVFGDFRRGAATVLDADPGSGGQVPIEDTPDNRGKLRLSFLGDYRKLAQKIKPKIEKDIGQAPAGSSRFNPADLDAAGYLKVARATKVLLLKHTDGERRAYHATPDCFGLAGSKAMLMTVTLDTVEGDSNHPPCVSTRRTKPLWKRDRRRSKRRSNPASTP